MPNEANGQLFTTPCVAVVDGMSLLCLGIRETCYLTSNTSKKSVVLRELPSGRLCATSCIGWLSRAEMRAPSVGELHEHNKRSADDENYH